jgi:hypothetical protein
MTWEIWGFALAATGVAVIAVCFYGRRRK